MDEETKKVSLTELLNLLHEEFENIKGEDWILVRNALFATYVTLMDEEKLKMFLEKNDWSLDDLKREISSLL